MDRANSTISPQASQNKSTMREAAMADKQADEAKRREPRKQPRRPRPSLLERIQPDAAGVDCGEQSHFVAVPVERDPEPVRESALSPQS
jgi:hypothetical protein